MKKFVSRATPLSIILNIILVINVIVVLYPVLFTISSSFSVSSSLAATSVIPFTDEKDVSTNVCVVCNGTAKKADSSADTTEWEKQIDHKVYELYRLTEDEIAIAEGR